MIMMIVIPAIGEKSLEHYATEISTTLDACS